MAYERNKILKKYLLLCEGIDAMNFFIPMLSSSNFCSDERIANEIQVMNFGGINELSKYLGTLRLREKFDDVKSILIVRDAENDADSAVRSIKNSLKLNQFSVPSEPAQWCNDCNNNPKIAFVLFPDLNKTCRNGTLEDLCCNLIAEQNHESIFKDIDAFLNTMQANRNFEYPRIFKNRLHTYFSVKDEFVSFKIGEAAKANAFDWKSDKLDIFRELLLQSFD